MKNIGQTILFLGLAATAHAAQVDFNRFSGLYTREQDLKDTIGRLTKMENLRSTAQESLERLMLQRRTVDLELRYGELIVQRGRDLLQFSVELSVAGDQQRADELKKQSIDLLNRGLRLHSDLLPKMNKHSQVGQVYLGMARTQYALNRKSQALNYADEGIRVPGISSQKETLLQLHIVRGDAAFDLSRGLIAEDSYQKALTLSSGQPMEEAYLNYKLGWVRYNLKDTERALKHLDEVFSVGLDRFALRQEAVMDYGLFLADLSDAQMQSRGGVAAAYAELFRRSPGNSAAAAIERMAHTLSRNGRRARGVEAMEFLIKEIPKDEKNIDRALTVVEWSRAVANKADLTERYHWLIRDFGPKSIWFSAQSQNPQIQKSARDRIEVSVREYATKLHQEANKEALDDLRRRNEDVVAKLYDTHIENFSRLEEVPTIEAARIHYYRAEIHRRRQEWSDSGTRYDDYLRVLEKASEELSKIDVKLKSEALLGSVQVWAKAIEKDQAMVPRMLGAADAFLRDRPSDSKAPLVLLDSAKVELKIGRGPLALSKLDLLIQNYPKTPETVEAVNATLDILNKENDWINLAAKARQFIDRIDQWVPVAEKKKQSDALLKILSQTEAKACEALRTDPKRQLEAAMCFIRYAKGFEKDEQAPKALLLAAETFDQVKDAGAAVEALELLVKKYPQSPVAESGFNRLATVYEKAFDFEKAVEIYGTLLKRSSIKGSDRDALAARFLDLLAGLGRDKEMNDFLAQPNTPAAVKRDFAERKEAQSLALLRSEEIAFGYGKQGLASAAAQKAFADLKSRIRGGSYKLETFLEVKRIDGIYQRLENRLDLADQEWMSGLKAFWASSDRRPEIWDAAARLRLEQASVWETAFRNTSLMKNPERKAELFSRLEKWYAEVVQMKAPAAALGALWKSAELNAAFAEEFRSTPVPEELLAAERQAEKAAYEKLIFERTEPLRKKGLAIVEEIAKRARDWRVVSPVVLSSLKVVSNLRQGVELPGRLVESSDAKILKFPWSELPVWMDLNKEQLSWNEWNLDTKALRRLVDDPKEKRSVARRAAFVILSRDLDLGDPKLASWSRTFTDQAGVQLRIQSDVASGNLSRAQLFLDQYRSFFGADAFLEFQLGEMDWRKGDYLQAYTRWVRPETPSAKEDFRSEYYAAGWTALFDLILQEQKSDRVQRSVFSRLAPKAKENWHWSYIAKLCVNGESLCEGPLKGEGLINVLADAGDPHYRITGKVDQGVLQTRQAAIRDFVRDRILGVSQLASLEPFRKLLSAHYELQSFAVDRRPIANEFAALKTLVDRHQDYLDTQNKNRVVAGERSDGSEP